MNTLKLYICRALSRASDSLTAKAKTLEDAIKKHRPAWQVIPFFGLGPSEDESLIIRYDLGRVIESDLIVVLADEDTWGGGIEVGWGLAHGKKMLLVASHDWKKTRMITGIPGMFPGQAAFERCMPPLFEDGRPLITFEGQVIAMIDRAIERFGIGKSPVPKNDSAFEYSPTGTDHVEFSTDSPHFLRRGGLAG